MLRVTRYDPWRVDHETFEAHLAHLVGGPKPVTDPTEVDRYRCETTTGIPIGPH